MLILAAREILCTGPLNRHALLHPLPIQVLLPGSSARSFVVVFCSHGPVPSSTSGPRPSSGHFQAGTPPCGEQQNIVAPM